MGPIQKKRKLFDDEAECSDDDYEEEESTSSSDSEDSLKDFVVPEGELSDSHFYDDKPTKAKPPTKRRPGRPPGPAKTKAETSKLTKPPGDAVYPLNDFSLTVTKTGGDVSIDALDSIAKFIEEHCVKGGVATEVGQRAFAFHLQGMFRIHWPAHKQSVQELQRILKKLLPDAGKGYKVNLKKFGTNQTFIGMIGYITKDQGILLHNFMLHCVRLILIFCLLYFIRPGPLSDSHSPYFSSRFILWAPRA